MTRQELYQRIANEFGTKEAFVLSEMKRLGFWDNSAEQPQVAESLLREQGELHLELNRLFEQQRRHENRNAVLREMHARRKQQALQRRQETKERRLKARQEKAALWAERQAGDIVFVGAGVSGGMSERQSQTGRLAQWGLPVLHTAADLAELLDCSLGELRFLCFRRRVSRISHYRRFQIAKKTGGLRQISAPMPRLKRLQYAVLNEILYKAEIHAAAHGFVPQRSIVSNAEAHTGKAVVINIDLKDFFPTVHYRRVRGLFVGMGYSEQVATLLGLLCTEPQTDRVELDGQTYYVRRDECRLPQGAPCSPALTNLLCRRLDRRLSGLAARRGWTYTRYADDLTFSAPESKDLNLLLRCIRQIVQEEGFTVHPDKLRIMRRGSRQEVTGVVVNRQTTVARDRLKRFRALLHHIETKGTAGAHWGQGNAPLLPSLLGYAHFVQMVNPDKGAPLLQRAQAIVAKHKDQWLQEQQHLQKPQTQSAVSESTVQSIAQTKNNKETPEEEKKKWWDIF